MRRFRRPARNAGPAGLAFWEALYGASPPEKQTPPGKGGVAEQLGDDQDQADVSTEHVEPQAVVDQGPAEAKAAAIALYEYGLLSLEAVERLFYRNPRWRSA